MSWDIERNSKRETTKYVGLQIQMTADDGETSSMLGSETTRKWQQE